jgi:ABC-type nitrate/sulfonate/bicarbonate transport system substrate-binding protein
MTTRVRLGAFSPSVLLRVARSTGRLDAVGLAVDEVPVPSSPAQFRSLLDGDLDVALTSPDNAVAYRFSPANPLGATADVRVVAAVDRGMGLALYAAPGLGPDDLRGATLAVDVATSGFAFAMYALADSLGLGREDYQLVALGSTPNRARALVDGGCAATMLNAGNDLRAELSGCTALARVREVCAPYLGTVLAVVGDTRQVVAVRLSAALDATARAVLAGELDAECADEAADALGLPAHLAARYVDRLKDPDEGLVLGAAVDPAALRTVVDLRRRYLPAVVDGRDLLEPALDPRSGLLVGPAAG